MRSVPSVQVSGRPGIVAVAVLVGAALGCTLACDRSEGMHTAAAGAAPATASGGAPSISTATPAATTTEKPPCVVPTPAEAPKAEEPASICPTEPAPGPELPKASVKFPAAPGSPSVRVEVATKREEQSRGLMYRTSMPEEQGMLFSWPDESIRSFWMRNTCIPLDMLFIAKDGTIAGIQEQVPVLNDRARSVPCLAAHVLEVNAGWCRRHGVVAGMRVTIEN